MRQGSAASIGFDWSSNDPTFECVCAGNALHGMPWGALFPWVEAAEGGVVAEGGAAGGGGSFRGQNLIIDAGNACGLRKWRCGTQR
jgi:hypothetical protein